MGAMDFLMTEREQRIFAALFLHPDASYSFSELTRIAGRGFGPTHNLLEKLHQAGVVCDERVGNQRRFRVNQRWPLFREFRAICAKSFGFREKLADALGTVASRIKLAFVFGSVAKGVERADSDIDLFVVGDIGLIELNALLSPAEEALGRPIHANLHATEDWSELMNDSVIKNILHGPKIMVIGDEPTEEH